MAATTTTYTSQQSLILASMIAYLQNPSNWPSGIPLLTDFTPGSVVYTILSAMAVAVDANGLAIFMARLAAYISTAVGQDLDNKVTDFGIVRKQATAGVGTFTFARNNVATSNIDIPAGSLVSTIPTLSADAVTYATQADATLLISTSSVDVVAIAGVAGTIGNITAGTQLLLASSIPGVDFATITNSITDGSDIETDDALRARGLAAFVALAHGTITSYQQIVLAVPGVAAALVVPQNRGPGTVDIFIEGPGGSVPSSGVQADAQAAINLQKVATDDVRVLLPSLVTVNATVSVLIAAGFDPTTTTAEVATALTIYIDALGVGANGTNKIYAAHLVAVAIGVDGVLNATTSFTDTTITSQQIPNAGTITVNTI